MKRNTLYAVLAIGLIASAGASFIACAPRKTIVVGSKDFSENIILGETFAQLIERKTSYEVSRKLNLGGTFVCFEALKRGDIDLYAEYSGTGLSAQLKMPVISDPDRAYRVVKSEFDRRFNLEWLAPLGFNNTYAIAVKAELAKKWGLSTIGDLGPHAGKVVFGAEHEFFNRQDGYQGLIQTYGLMFRDVAKMGVALKYQAIGEGRVQATDVFTTDSQILSYGLTLLKDDKAYFPPYFDADT